MSDIENYKMEENNFKSRDTVLFQRNNPKLLHKQKFMILLLTYSPHYNK